jgi:phage terminase large subunit-like protein
MEWFRATKVHREVAMIAGNRVGKSEAGAYMTTVFLTGDYPHWWQGRRFPGPITAWAAGTTNEKTREIVQEKLLGRLTREPGDDPTRPIGLGTGMIPYSRIAAVEKHPQIPNAVKSTWIKHSSGGRSLLTFKSFEQGRPAFEGTTVHAIWGDEEMPIDCYSEALMRTMTCDGVIYLTFTPLAGLSELVLQFMPDGDIPAEQVPV